MSQRRFESPVAAERGLIVYLRSVFPAPRVNVERLALIWSHLLLVYDTCGAPDKSYSDWLRDFPWLTIRQLREAFIDLQTAGLLSSELLNSGVNRWTPTQPEGCASSAGEGAPQTQEGCASSAGGVRVKRRGHNITVSLSKEEFKKEVKKSGSAKAQAPTVSPERQALETKLPDDKCRSAWQSLVTAMRMSRRYNRVAESVLVSLLTELLASIELNGFDSEQIQHGFLACAKCDKPAENERYFRHAAFGYKRDDRGSAEPLTVDNLREAAIGQLGFQCTLADVEEQMPDGNGEGLNGGYRAEWRAVVETLAGHRDKQGAAYTTGFARNTAVLLIASAVQADLWPNAVAYGLQQLISGAFNFNGCTGRALVNYVLACARNYKMTSHEYYAGSPNHALRKQESAGLGRELARKMTGWEGEDVEAVKDEVPPIETVSEDYLREKYLK